MTDTSSTILVITDSSLCFVLFPHQCLYMFVFRVLMECSNTFSNIWCCGFISYIFCAIRKTCFSACDYLWINKYAPLHYVLPGVVETVIQMFCSGQLVVTGGKIHRTIDSSQ